MRFALLLYVSLSLITASAFLGDTVDYASSIVLRFHGKYGEFWEFGHILWRPVGWAITRTIETVRPDWVKGNAADYHVVLTLIAVSWLAGFATLYLFHRMACFATNDFWCASLSTVGFATAQAFLNFVQAGTAYIAGLALLTLAIYTLYDVGDDPFHADRISALGGFALAGAVLFWFPYVLVVPAVVFIPLVLRRALRSSLITGVSFAIAVGLVYLAVIVGLGLHSRAQILAWLGEASHGIQIAGVARAVFGFARSFINMGEDGTLFKRYLLHDPFSPVSVAALLRIALAKLVFFYALLASVVATLLIAKRWRLLGLLTMASAPVLLFAVRWQGGDMERYLPLYPFLFLAIALCLSERAQRFQRLLSVTFIATMALVNIFALSRHANKLQEETIVRRASDISPSLLNAAGVLYVTHQGDEFSNFARSFPLDPFNRSRSFRVLMIIETGHSDVPMWKATFSRNTLGAWERQGNVWVSRRVFSPSPQPGWNWVEHDDPRISWKDLSPFFSRLEYEQCVGGSDGFCLLAPSSANRQFLAHVTLSPM